MADSALQHLIDELTVTHPRVAVVKGQPVEGDEPALLELLHEAIGSTTTSDGGKGGGGTPSVIDADALALWSSVREQVRAAGRDARWSARVPDLGPRHRDAQLRALIRAWYRDVTRNGAPMSEQVNLYVLALTWVQDIRAHFNPEKRVPLRGQQCPACKSKTFTAEGSKTRTPDITLVYTQPAPIAVCNACGESWSGGELLDLHNGKTPAGKD